MAADAKLKQEEEAQKIETARKEAARKLEEERRQQEAAKRQEEERLKVRTKHNLTLPCLSLYVFIFKG